jgi:hypothetical protein
LISKSSAILNEPGKATVVRKSPLFESEDEPHEATKSNTKFTEDRVFWNSEYVLSIKMVWDFSKE